MPLKRITAKVVGTHKSKVYTIDIEGGTTPKDIKKQMNVPKSYRTFRRKTREFLSDADDLGSILETGESIEFSPEAKFGR
ncbi:MAG: hypothetical protein JSV43_06460 [Methanobacteriota archaeon]|nr:MAG: hypothetical protein JSV43_06460 [Euryarchaeota archaeon]